MNNLIEAIDKQASALPPEFQREVLDFIGYLHAKNERQADPAWLERAWGAAPDFPDRLPNPHYLICRDCDALPTRYHVL